MILIIILITLNFINLYTNSQDLKVTPQQVSIECNKRGYPTTNALKALIAAHYMNINTKNIKIQETSGGYYTEKMYVVSTKKNKPLLFFKISKKNDSTKKLLKIQEGHVGQKFIKASSSKKSHGSYELPAIIWLEDIFIYKSNKGETKTIEVTPSAQGALIEDILKSQDQTTIKQAAQALGKSLASFHQIYMNLNDFNPQDPWKSVFHGDLSIRNALFDKQTNKIYFIDNETMQEGSIGQDIKTILVSVLMFRYLQKHYHQRWPNYLEYCQLFLKSYIESYPTYLQAQLATYLEEILHAGLKKVLYEKIIKISSINKNKFNKKEFNRMVQNTLLPFKKLK